MDVLLCLIFLTCFHLVAASLCEQASLAHSSHTHMNTGVNEEFAARGYEFLFHVLQHIGWTTVTIIHDSSDFHSKDFTDRVSERHIQLMVFQQTSANDSVYPVNISEAAARANGQVHMIILGRSDFVLHVLKEVASSEDQSLLFHTYWLTVVSTENITSFLHVATRFENLAYVECEANGQQSLRTLTRQGNTISASLIMEWLPYCTKTAQTLDDNTVFPNHNYGLGGRTLKIVTLRSDPFVKAHDSENGVVYTGFCIDLLEYLARSLNFTYIITEQADGAWGQLLPNGTWIGMTATLARKEADFALSGMSVTPERATVSDYSKGFCYDEIVLLVNRPSVGAGWDFFLRPFHWMVYAVIGVSLLVVTVLFVWIERREKQRQNEGQMSSTLPPSLVSDVVKTVETLLGSLLGRAVEYEVGSHAGHILVSAWLMASVILVAMYTSKLTSFSVLTKSQLPFSSLRELVNQDQYKWGMTGGGTYLNQLMSTSEDEDYKKFYEGCLRFAQEDPDVFHTKSAVHLEKVTKERYVYLTVSSVYHRAKSTHCQLDIVPERLFGTDILAIHFQKGSPYTQLFNEKIEIAEELGLLANWNRKWFKERTVCDQDRQKVITVSLHLMQSALAVAGLGLVVAGLVLGMELCFKRCCSRR